MSYAYRARKKAIKRARKALQGKPQAQLVEISEDKEQDGTWFQYAARIEGRLL